jgi:hypothetical protein
VVLARIPSERSFEIIARDLPVKAAGLRDAMTTNSRLGDGLQRLFEPMSDDPLYGLDHLLMLLDKHSVGQK